MKKIVILCTTLLAFAAPSWAQGDWVDLGLPSGLLWATHNVGANKPEEFGDHFSWGETEPKSEYRKLPTTVISAAMRIIS